MSDDLISRKALMENVAKSMVNNTHENPYVKLNHRHEHTHFLNMIREAPSAYDADLVCEQLEKMKKIMLSPTNVDCFGDPCRESDCTACVLNRAIEIVRNGGAG